MAILGSIGGALVACGDDDDDAAPAEGSENTSTSTTQPAATDAALQWERVSLEFVSAYVLARGDAAAVVDTGTEGSTDGPNPEFTANMETAIASVEKLACLTYETVVFGHGDPVERGAAQTVADLAATL